MAVQLNGVLITEDKDLGDLIYRHAHQEYEQAVARLSPMRWSNYWRRNLDAWLAGEMSTMVDIPDDETGAMAPLPDEDEVPEALIDGARPVAHIDAHAARWFASKRMFSAVHLVAEGAPTDEEVPDYLRRLADGAGAPRHVLDGIGPPREAT